MRKTMLVSALLGLVLLVLPGIAAAAELTNAELQVAINTMWVLLAGFLVFLMHAGFSMVESGFTQSKNTVNIMMELPDGRYRCSSVLRSRFCYCLRTGREGTIGQ